MNLHRKAKTGCKHVIKHFRKACPGAGFKIQVIEIFSGSGYRNNKVCKKARKKRIVREDYWMKELRTVYPYGLNERVRCHDQDIPVGKLYPRIPRSGGRNTRNRNNRNLRIEYNNHTSVFKFINTRLNKKSKNLTNLLF